MIINDFNLRCIALPPDKTNSGLMTDTYIIKQVADEKVIAMGSKKRAKQGDSLRKTSCACFTTIYAIYGLQASDLR